jgi:hypothetical protein
MFIFDNTTLSYFKRLKAAGFFKLEPALLTLAGRFIEDVPHREISNGNNYVLTTILKL